MALATGTREAHALLLLEGERDVGPDAGTLHGAAERTFEKLRRHLVRRLGSGGYRALLARAVALAASDVPWLAEVHVTEDAALEGFGAGAEGRAASDTTAGAVAILARLIGLLETFVGQALCLRLLQDVWPGAAGLDAGVPPGDTQGNEGDGHG